MTEILYTGTGGRFECLVVSVLQTHVPQPPDILVFLTGQEEIEAAVENLLERTKALGARIKEPHLPHLRLLPPNSRPRSRAHAQRRGKLSGTNIGETPLTIDGICRDRYRFCKQKTYNPRRASSRRSSLQLGHGHQRESWSDGVAPVSAFIVVFADSRRIRSRRYSDEHEPVLMLKCGDPQRCTSTMVRASAHVHHDACSTRAHDRILDAIAALA